MSNTKINVFLIDDSEEDNFYVEDIISENERIGEVTSFLDSEKALQHIIDLDERNQELPHLILIDVRMPDLDGFEWIDEIDQHFREFKPVLMMLTSSRHRKDVESFDKQFLAKELLSKPLEQAVFDELLKKYF
jgi:CheY-like chemotaxis protein